MLTPAYASQLRLVEGATLFYKGFKISTGIGGSQTWDASVKILTLNETTLVFQSEAEEVSSRVTVKYQEGIPTYVDYLTALIYLPPECLAESMKGNLEWTTTVNTRTLATVTNKTWQTRSFEVGAGVFQTINITLTLAGMDSGTLTFIYDVDSGILVYEQWVPSYGDIVILSLMAATYAPGPQQTILNLILPATALATPAAIAIRQTRKTLKKRSPKSEQPLKDAFLRSGFPEKPFYITLAGALLILTSVFLPWSQFAGLQMHLPLSLPLALGGSAGPFASAPVSTTISLMAHSAAILVWLSIAMHLYTSKKLAPQLATIASSLLAFASAITFVQSGWTPSWGVPITAIGGILSILGVTTTNIKIEIVTEDAEEPEEHIP